jgi:transcriptional regulator with GAF, ATPase, and Fis domain
VPTQEERLSRTFVELADTLVDDFDVVDLYATLAERCVVLFDVAAAGLVLTDTEDSLRLVASTSEAIGTVELFQLQNDEGPCLDSFRTRRPVLVPDLSAQRERWPTFAPFALDAGFRAVSAFPLRLRARALGALNLFGSEPHGMRPAERSAAQALADVATIALLQYRAVRDAETVSAQLQVALNSRIAIEQAKGVIAESLGVDMNEAFRRLRTYARGRGLALSGVAEEIATTVRPPVDFAG